MSETQKSATKNVDTLRRELRELRSKAREDGMTGAIVDDWAGSTGLAPGSRKAVMDAITPADKSKTAATMLLTLLRRMDKDDSPLVPGTNFTEAGVQRMLRQMRLPKYQTGPAGKIMQRLHTYLTKGKPGAILVAGVSVERLRQLGGLLEQIEKHGWEQAKAMLEEQFDIPTAKRPKPVIDAEAEAATASATQITGPGSAN
jgi:hypothetical protein